MLFTAREVGRIGNEDNRMHAETSMSRVGCAYFLGQLRDIVKRHTSIYACCSILKIFLEFPILENLTGFLILGYDRI